MNLKNAGLTVGELTMTIGVLFLVFIAWSAVGKREKTNQTQWVPINQEIILNIKSSQTL